MLQWTEKTRKQGLLDYAESKGKSVGDFYVQLDYFCYEVTEGSYKSKFQTFLQITDINEATDYFCEKIEQAGKPKWDECEKYAIDILEEFESKER